MRVFPLGSRSTRVTQAGVIPGRSFCSTFPDNLSGGIDLQHGVTIAGPNQGIAIGKPGGAEHGVSESLGSVASLPFLAKERDVVLPDDLPGWDHTRGRVRQPSWATR